MHELIVSETLDSALDIEDSLVIYFQNEQYGMFINTYQNLQQFEITRELLYMYASTQLFFYGHYSNPSGEEALRIVDSLGQLGHLDSRAVYLYYNSRNMDKEERKKELFELADQNVCIAMYFIANQTDYFSPINFYDEQLNWMKQSCDCGYSLSCEYLMDWNLMGGDSLLKSYEYYTLKADSLGSLRAKFEMSIWALDTFLNTRSIIDYKKFRKLDSASKISTLSQSYRYFRYGKTLYLSNISELKDLGVVFITSVWLQNTTEAKEFILEHKVAIDERSKINPDYFEEMLFESLELYIKR